MNLYGEESVSYSIQRAVSDGSLNRVAVSLAYLDKSDISVWVDDIQIPETGASQYAWHWDGDDIVFDSPIPSGIEVLVRRSTNRSAVQNVFSGRAEFSNKTMDENFTQMLYLAQEYSEGSGLRDVFSDINMHGYKITNTGFATEDDDVVTLKQYREDAEGARVAMQRAETAATKAEQHEQNTHAIANQAQTDITASKEAAITEITNRIAPEVDKARVHAVAAQSAADTAVGASNRSETVLQHVQVLEDGAELHAGTAEAAKDEAIRIKDLAKDWATKLNDTVDGSEYSAKHYANEAKKSADKTDSDLTAINTAKANALSAIDTSKTSAVKAVTDEGSTQSALINSEGDAQVQRVIDEGATQVSAVGTKGTQEVQKITAEGTKQVQAVQTEGTTSAKKVTDEGTKQIGIVSAQGTTSANAVKAQQTTSTNAVIAEGNKQIKRVTDHGTTTIGLVTAEGTKQATRVTDTGSAQVTNVQTEGTKQVDLAKAEVTKATAQTAEATKQAGIATTKANEASASASTATAKANTATQQATLATTKASEAEYSATSASQSATAANASANSAGASADTATTQATNAINSAKAAKLSEDNAALSKTAAGTSATNAKASEVEAKKQADLAKDYAEQAASGQINSDWAETDSSQKSFIKNKPTLGALASKDSIDYSELTGTPPEVDLSGYATKTELTSGLAGKQPVGDYATNTALTSGLAGKVNTSTYTSDKATFLTKTEASNTYLGKTAKAASASTADSATKATKDASGNVITTTYATKSEVTSGLAGKQPAGDYATNTALTEGLATKLGATAKAVSAGTADSATKATQDANGNVIHTTYATKSELGGISTYASKEDIISAAETALNGANPVSAGDPALDKIKTSIAGLQASIVAIPTPNAYIVDSWSSGSDWYRVWSDGWIEQGSSAKTSRGSTVTLHKQFSSPDYTILTQSITPKDINSVELHIRTRSATSFVITCSFDGNANYGYGDYIWYAFGY